MKQEQEMSSETKYIVCSTLWFSLLFYYINSLFATLQLSFAHSFAYSVILSFSLSVNNSHDKIISTIL